MIVNFTLLIPNNADTNASLYGFFLSNMPLGLDYRPVILIDRPKEQVWFITESKKHPQTALPQAHWFWEVNIKISRNTADKYAQIMQCDSKVWEHWRFYYFALYCLIYLFKGFIWKLPDFLCDHNLFICLFKEAASMRALWSWLVDK